MHSVGVDIIEIARVEEAVNTWGERFLRRIYTELELRLCNGHAQSYAVRFAGKEAVMKALGTGVRGISWREIEILAESSGKPWVRLSGKAQNKAVDLGLTNLAISLSHSREYAVAFVVGDME